jgi:hypothetical protein
MREKLLHDLNNRYATKKFDSIKKVSDADFQLICEALRLFPSSYGLQPVKFIIVKTESIRLELQKAAFGQTQISEASHLIVLCALDSISHDYVDGFIKLLADTREMEVENLIGFGANVKASIEKMSEESMQIWNDKQVYIALGQLLHTCAVLHIDATPMEGFNKSEFDRILNLKEQNLHSVLACPIGYRSENDAYSKLKKARKSMDALFEIR